MFKNIFCAMLLFYFQQDLLAVELAQQKPNVDLADRFEKILAAHVDAKDGRVDYVNLAKNRKELQEFLKAHSALDLKNWNDEEKTALLINFYNAGMMENILRSAEENKISIESKDFLALEVNDLKTSGGNIWSGSYKYNLAGRDVNLDNVEHDLIRGKGQKEFGELAVSKLDPRIHTAVNCAAMSCPRVREKAYRVKILSHMLDENMREFVANERQFKKVAKGKLRANSIVMWYYSDFDEFAQKQAKLKGAGEYLGKYIMDEQKDGLWIRTHLMENFNDRSTLFLRFSSAFEFYYDWRVNDQRNAYRG